MAEKRIELFFQEQPSDKVYNVELVKTKKGWTVHVEWGRRGSNLQKGTKAVDATLEAAEKAFDKVVRQKTRKGYEEWTEDNVPAAVAPEKGKGSASKAGIVTRSKVGVAAQLLNNVAAGKLDKMFKDRNFWAQQKFDGKRVIVHIQQDSVLMTNRQGQETALEKKVADALWEIAPVGSIFDGELCRSPLTYWVFDLLAWGKSDLRKQEYLYRYAQLKQVDIPKHCELVPTATNEKAKRALYNSLMEQAAEGIVFKRMDAPYESGRPSSGGPQLKHKFIKTADVIITENAGNAYRMAVYDEDGELMDIGKVFAGTTTKSRQVLDAVLSEGETPIAEVKYLYATKDDNLFQPVFVRLRTDKKPEACLYDQLEHTDQAAVGEV